MERLKNLLAKQLNFQIAMAKNARKLFSQYGRKRKKAFYKAWLKTQKDSSPISSQQKQYQKFHLPLLTLAQPDRLRMTGASKKPY